jgi:hypothetical protein
MALLACWVCVRGTHWGGRAARDTFGCSCMVRFLVVRSVPVVGRLAAGPSCCFDGRKRGDANGDAMPATDEKIGRDVERWSAWRSWQGKALPIVRSEARAYIYGIRVGPCRGRIMTSKIGNFILGDGTQWRMILSRKYDLFEEAQRSGGRARRKYGSPPGKKRFGPKRTHNRNLPSRPNTSRERRGSGLAQGIGGRRLRIGNRHASLPPSPGRGQPFSPQRE